MTIDERLDRLTERHEALIHSLKFTAEMQRDLSRRIAKLGASAAQDGGRIRALLRIAEIRDRRA